MATTLTIKKGDSDTFTEVIVGLDSASGYNAMMYVYDAANTTIAAVSGVISNLTISYDLVNEVSKLLTVGEYYYETKIWDASDHVYTPDDGIFVIESTHKSDPS